MFVKAIENLPKLIVRSLPVLLVLFVLFSACTVEPEPTEPPTPPPNPTEEPTETVVPDETGEGDSEAASNTLGEEPILTTPTLAPTSTPGPIDEFVSQIAENTGADRTYLLGLSLEDWANLVISLLMVLLGIFIVSRLVVSLLRRGVKSTPTPWDNQFVEIIKPQIRWIFAVFFLQFSTNRLGFLSPDLKHWLDQIYFGLYVFTFSAMIWKLIDLGEIWYEEKRAEGDQDERSDAILPIFKRTLRGILIVVAIIIILDRFGVNVTALTAAVGIGGLALSLAAQDTLADMISGLIILVDQPFRVGDRIEIESLNTWGDVVDIGTRTTRIRTRDNRMVIVPNSAISKSQVVNYTYPDPRYRVQIEIGVAYETDLDRVREIIIDAVSDVEGVLKDKPIDALFLEFGDTSMIIRVRWWIDSFEDTRRMFDKVNTNLKRALTDAKIDMPFTTYDINVRHIDDGSEENKEA